jgi:hypothetical protein
MPKGAANRFRRTLAGLLALAMVVLSGVPLPAFALPAGHPHVAYAWCLSAYPAGQAAASSQHDFGKSCADHDTPHGSACCTAKCFVICGGLLAAPTHTEPPLLTVAYPAAVIRHLDGIGILPILPPPRLTV